jgi:hypothetical protein
MFQPREWVYAAPETASDFPEIQGRNGIVILVKPGECMVDFGLDLSNYYFLRCEHLIKADIQEI